MCGIAGIISNSATNDLQNTLQRMTDAIVHRGPDEAGFYVHQRVGLGMRRLSIIDVQGGQQPISNETGDVQVVSNGEVYNHRDLRKSLLDAGHRLESHTDTEVIAHLYEDKGPECFRDMRGMFGTAIWDERNQQLVLGRDRLGKKPLYYAFSSNGQFLFGSEIKSLLAADASLGEPDFTRLAEYLQFGYLHEPNTFYRRIFKLPAGHYGILKDGQFQIRSFWDLDFQVDESRSWEDWAEALDAAILESVSVRLESEVPLGVFLSGGIDSSAIVAYAHAAGLSPLRTFTIAFDRP
ncbi:MAG: asparagine synthase (glutamine-hydrolyzing), partial [Planctomycetota bacterium]